MAVYIVSNTARGRATHLKADSIGAILMVIVIGLCAAFSIYEQRPPAAAPANVPADTFSATRALNYLAAIAVRPHPMGSPEHDAVRDYLMRELSAAGLSPEIQHATVVDPGSKPVRIGAVQNVIARLKGTGAGGKSVLLVAHYDSVANSFGANDDGSGVATLLETLKALKAGPPLRNDVVFLFTDGEESGLLGAKAFATEHVWAKDVGIVQNFEARGNSGPAIMFESSDNNGWLIREFAEAAPFPVANSLSYELYRLLPNDTDLSVFRKAGMPGFNFANINGLGSYHTSFDNLSEVDSGSLQHKGTYALSLTRRLGNLELGQTKERNAVYFDIFGNVLVHYSSFLVIPLAVGIGAVFVLLVGLGFKRNKLMVGGIALGFISLLISMLLAAGITTALWKAIWLVRGEDGATPAASQSGMLLLSFVAVAIAITASVYSLMRRRTSVESLVAGSLLWWLILLATSSFFLPGGSFIFAWPLAFNLIAFGWLILSQPVERSRNIIQLLVLTACAAPGVFLLAPVIYQIFVGLTLNWTFAVITMVVLSLGLLVPHLQLLDSKRRWLLPGVAAVAGLLLLILGSVANYNAPASPNSLFYAWNVDSGRAVWASDARRRDEWTEQFFSAGEEKGGLADFAYGRTSRQYSLSPAPTASLAAPELSLVEDHTADGVRTLRLRLSSAKQVGTMSLYLDSKAEVVQAAINDKPINADHSQMTNSSEENSQWGLRFLAFPRQGVDLRLQFRASEPIKLRVVDQSYGLPTIEGATFKARSDSSNQGSIINTESTLITKSFAF